MDIVSFNGKHYKLFYSGLDENSKNRSIAGVGIIIRGNTGGEFVHVSERICFLNFKRNEMKYTVISAYAHTNPTSDKNPEMRQEFYETLETIINLVSNSTCLIIGGDFNAKTGSSFEQYRCNMMENDE